SPSTAATSSTRNTSAAAPALATASTARAARSSPRSPTSCRSPGERQEKRRADRPAFFVHAGSKTTRRRASVLLLARGQEIRGRGRTLDDAVLVVGDVLAELDEVVGARRQAELVPGGVHRRFRLRRRVGGLDQHEVPAGAGAVDVELARRQAGHAVDLVEL